MSVTLRPVVDDDLADLFALESEVAGHHMIAFLPRDPGDRAAFDAHWSRIRADPDSRLWIIEHDGTFAGYALSFLMNGERHVGYWVRQRLWGRGIASAALTAMLGLLDERPLWASTASDNLGSQRVLRNGGFEFQRVERTHAHGRGGDVDEHVFKLD